EGQFLANSSAEVQSVLEFLLWRKIRMGKKALNSSDETKLKDVHGDPDSDIGGHWRSSDSVMYKFILIMRALVVFRFRRALAVFRFKHAFTKNGIACIYLEGKSTRSLLLKELNDINSIGSLEAAQKSKVRWAIEGGENTKFFHGILNSKRSQLAIRATIFDVEWIVDPLAVKSVFLKYFSTRFSLPVSPRIGFIDQFTNRLSLEKQVDL
ncbi:hypothetical protein Tco_0986859, partial [Tanacetum coccineum]